MIIFVDIDNTITKTVGTDYENAEPLHDRINKINNLYDEGNTIVYWTARGSGSGKQYFKVTQNQLNSWSAKYHELRMGKPVFDMFIDDKVFNSEEYFK